MENKAILKARDYYDYQVPMLLVPSKEKDIWQLYDVMKKSYCHDLKLNLKHYKRFSGSSKGWLVKVNRDYTVTLHKPNIYHNSDGDDGQTICLPPLFPPQLVDPIDSDDDEVDMWDYPPCGYHIHKALITSDPLLNSEESTIVVIFGEYQDIAFLRLSNKNTCSWTKLEVGLMFCDLLYHESRVYGLCPSRRVVSFDVNKDDDLDIVMHSSSSHVEAYNSNKYLVKTFRGEILLVVRFFDTETVPDNRMTYKFQVFKSLIYDNKWEWVDSSSLGDDVALFLGDNSSISVRASAFVGCQPNCIYFTHDQEDLYLNPYIRDLGFYRVETNKFEFNFGIHSDTLRAMAKQPPIWFVPTIHL